MSLSQWIVLRLSTFRRVLSVEMYCKRVDCVPFILEKWFTEYFIQQVLIWKEFPGLLPENISTENTV